MHEIEMPQAQRERFEKIKEECDTPDAPEPTDIEVLDSLMDTWELVGTGHYSEESRACPECGRDIREFTDHEWDCPLTLTEC